MAGEAGLCAFDLLTLKLVRNIAFVVGNLPTNFGVSTAFRSRVMDRHASDWSRDLVVSPWRTRHL